MKNYYTSFCESITHITAEEQAWLESQEISVNSEFIKTEGQGTVLFLDTQEASFDDDNILEILQEFLKRFRPDASIGIRYACYCVSWIKPVPGDAGGGLIFITAKNIERYDANEMYREKVVKFKGELKKKAEWELREILKKEAQEYEKALNKAWQEHLDLIEKGSGNDFFGHMEQRKQSQEKFKDLKKEIEEKHFEVTSNGSMRTTMRDTRYVVNVTYCTIDMRLKQNNS